MQSQRRDFLLGLLFFEVDCQANGVLHQQIELTKVRTREASSFVRKNEGFLIRAKETTEFCERQTDRFDPADARTYARTKRVCAKG